MSTKSNSSEIGMTFILIILVVGLIIFLGPALCWIFWSESDFSQSEMFQRLKHSIAWEVEVPEYPCPPSD